MIIDFSVLDKTAIKFISNSLKFNMVYFYKALIIFIDNLALLKIIIQYILKRKISIFKTLVELN